MLADITFYSVVLFVHVTSVILAFGVTFAYPIIFAMAGRSHERSLPALHAIQRRVGERLIAPFGGLALLAGIYLAADGPYSFSSFFVSAGILILVFLLAMGGLFFGPREARAAELAERDLAAGGPLSQEYHDVARSIALAGALSSGLILLAVFLMVTRLGA